MSYSVKKISVILLVGLMLVSCQVREFRRLPPTYISSTMVNQWFKEPPTDDLEGIWYLDDYFVAIKKAPGKLSTDEKKKYIGYIAGNPHNKWPGKGELLRVIREGDTLTMAKRSSSGYESFTHPALGQLLKLSPKGRFIEVLGDDGLFWLVPRVYPRQSGTFSEKFKADYFEGRTLDRLEGLWSLNDSTLGIVRKPKPTGNGYFGYVFNGNERGIGQGKRILDIRGSVAESFHTGFFFPGGHRNQHELTIKYIDQRTITFTPAIATPNKAVKYFPYDQVDVVRSSNISMGTGFLVTPNLVVTNNHVVNGAKEISVENSLGKTKAAVLAADPANDLAILVLPSPLGDQFFTLGQEMAEPGSRVYTIGYPLSTELGKTPRVSDGIVNSTVGLQNDPRILQVSIPVHPGNSGGPLINESGEVVGVVTSVASAAYFIKNYGTLPQNIGFAVKVDYLVPLLKQAGITLKPQQAARPISMRKRQDAVVFIETR